MQTTSFTRIKRFNEYISLTSVVDIKRKENSEASCSNQGNGKLEMHEPFAGDLISTGEDEE